MGRSWRVSPAGASSPRPPSSRSAWRRSPRRGAVSRFVCSRWRARWWRPSRSRSCPRAARCASTGGAGDGAGLLTALDGTGWPIVRPLPPDRTGARQFLVTWDGPPAADGARPLRFDVVREEAEGVRVAWSSAALLPEGLTARWYAVRGTEVTRAPRGALPGWTPGCDGQTEYEDVYRLAPGASTFARVSRRDAQRLAPRRPRGGGAPLRGSGPRRSPVARPPGPRRLAPGAAPRDPAERARLRCPPRARRHRVHRRRRPGATIPGR